MKKLYRAFFIISVFFISCSLLNSDNGGGVTIKTELPRDLTSQEKQLIEAGNAFSYNIFRSITASEERKNVIISPLSLSLALGMTLNGAAGDTRAEMKETLGMSAMELQQINQSYQSLIELLMQLDPRVEMLIANSFWSDNDIPIIADFKNGLTTYFNAEAQSLDFGDPETVNIINQWVSENTGGNIDKIIENIPPRVKVYLINAVYFKGNWLYEFDPQKTQRQLFYLADGSTVLVDMMQQEAELSFYQSDEVIIAELPYGNSLFRMTLLLPANSEQRLDVFIEKSLNGAVLQNWIEKLRKAEEAVIKMPKFEITYEKGLNDILSSMGMASAFDSQRAEFSNLSPVPMYIDTVFQKATITVNEEGTEASAATVAGGALTSAPPQIILNRPFVFMIRENVSGTILFMGQVYNPAN